MTVRERERERETKRLWGFLLEMKVSEHDDGDGKQGELFILQRRRRKNAFKTLVLYLPNRCICFI